MPKRLEKNETVDLLRVAAMEIDHLRKVNQRLTEYRDHTERLLALFEGGPRPHKVRGEEEDVAWKLRRMADKIENPESVA